MKQNNSEFGLIYQLFLGRQNNSNEINDDGEVLKKMLDWDWSLLSSSGFETIYLLGLFENMGGIYVNVEENVDISQHQNRCPSPFAITDHRKVKVKLGNEDDFKKLVSLMHESNLKVLVDLVPNHTGRDHAWVSSNPNYYQKDQGGLIAEFSGDVYKLDYSNEKLRVEIIETIKRIAESGVDGVRCDMAHLVPVDFWTEAIRQVREINQDFRFVAEAYTDSVFEWNVLDELTEVGFDQIYHEYLFRNILGWYEGLINDENLVDHINYFIDKENSFSYVNYVMNHDNYLSGKAREHLNAWTAWLILLPGTELIFNGQLNGLSQRLAHHWIEVLQRDMFEISQELPAWFKKLSKLTIAEGLIMTKVNVRENGLFEATLKGKVSGLKAYINIGESSVSYDQIELKENNIKWKLKKSSNLEVGDVLISG